MWVMEWHEMGHRESQKEADEKKFVEMDRRRNVEQKKNEEAKWGEKLHEQVEEKWSKKKRK